MTETDCTQAPDWRWKVAVQLADGDAPAPREFDPLIGRAATFLRLQRRARTRETRARLDETCPTIAEAQRIRFGQRDGRRDAIEVRLLAGYPPRLIAELTALPPATVWTYLSLFYDVGDRLDARDYVWTQLVGFCRDDGASEREQKAMRWLAWLGGPLVASAVLLPAGHTKLVESPEDIDATLIAATDSLVARAMILAPFIDRLDADRARRIMHGRVQARQSREADAGDIGQREYQKNVEAFLREFEITAGWSTIREDDGVQAGRTGK